MSDTGSALVVNEKRTQRRGGCVGIFFQLFDWRKRFAKKKFPPNKLLSLGLHSFILIHLFLCLFNFLFLIMM